MINAAKLNRSRKSYAWRDAIVFVTLLMCLLSLSEAFANTQKRFIRQDLNALRQKVVTFLNIQSAAYPGDVKVKAGSIDPNLKLAACLNPEAFLPPGSRAWGKTSVGIQCNAPAKWKIYVQAEVSIKAPYIVTAHPLSQGHTITEHDLTFAQGDLTRLPAGVFTDASQLVGQVVRSPMMAGTVLRQNMLKQALAIQQGQTVLLTTQGPGFVINAEGKAMKNASLGQVVPVKVRNGQVVSGIAKPNGKVAVTF